MPADASRVDFVRYWLTLSLAFWPVVVLLIRVIRSYTDAAMPGGFEIMANLLVSAAWLCSLVLFVAELRKRLEVSSILRTYWGLQMVITTVRFQSLLRREGGYDTDAAVHLGGEFVLTSAAWIAGLLHGRQAYVLAEHYRIVGHEAHSPVARMKGAALHAGGDPSRDKAPLPGVVIKRASTSTPDDDDGGGGDAHTFTEPLIAPHDLDPDFDHERELTPEVLSNIVEKWSYSWMNALLKVGFKTPLVESDLYHLPPRDQPDVLSDKFEVQWKAELAAHPDKPSLVRAIRKTFGSDFFSGGLYIFLQNMLSFVGPLVLNSVIIYLDECKRDPLTDEYIKEGGCSTDGPSQGYLLAGSLFFSAIAMTVFGQRYFHLMQRCGWRVRIALCGNIFKKSLQIVPGRQQATGVDADADDAKGDPKTSADTKNDGDDKAAAAKKGKDITTMGGMVNLMSIDAPRIERSIAMLHNAWASPLYIVLTLVLLWQQIGISTLAGLFGMLTSVPVSGFLIYRLNTIQRELMKLKDLRLKITNEVMTAMKIIKLYAWEESFSEKIKDLRDQELVYLKKYQKNAVFLRGIFFAQPLIVSLAAFFSYTVLEGKSMDAATAFTAISLFRLLQFPLIIFPLLLAGLVEVIPILSASPVLSVLSFLPSFHTFLFFSFRPSVCPFFLHSRLPSFPSLPSIPSFPSFIHFHLFLPFLPFFLSCIFLLPFV
jgi:hypothetical protein